jgi:hypothetical protein
MRYIFHSRVSTIERKRRAVRAHKVGNDVEVEYEDLGWFARIEPFFASISLGDAEPPWQPGQLVKLTIEEEAE